MLRGMKRKVSGGFEPVLAIGLMSGTSLDGVDAVLLETDGEGRIKLKGSAYVPYPKAVRERAKSAAKGDVPLDEVLRLERDLSKLYVQAIKALKVDSRKVAVVGCHGQTIRHLPDEGLTWQLGDPNYIAAEIGIATVMDFRRRDMALGGQGAPLVPLFHQALLAGRKGVVVLNLGGVSNVTVFGARGSIAASDCGPGVGLMDMYMQARGKAFDENGALAAKGKADMKVVEAALKGGFFAKKLPRSAHRHEFDGILAKVKAMRPADAMATLCAITAGAIARTLEAMKVEQGVPVVPVGGGARNPALLKALGRAGLSVVPAAKASLRAETMEAECFAWLAVRRLRNLPFSVPATTGCKAESVGGTLTS